MHPSIMSPIMLTVSQLAKKFNISRSTLLYYEREGLLIPTLRSDNGYRWYADNEIARLKAIVSYRSFGIPIASISELLAQDDELTQTQVMRNHFHQLEKEIDKLRLQQKAIVILLQEPELLGEQGVTKARWVEIMIEAGFDEDAMTLWHQKFEQLKPNEHQQFLQSLGISATEIKHIRQLS